MRLLLTPEQQQLRSAVRTFLADRSSSARVRAAMASETGHDADLWRGLATELDVLGLVVPEKYGGAGAGHAERAVVLEELGRALAPSPFLGSAVLATDTLLALDDERARADLLPRLVSGDLVATVAVAEGGGAWSDDGGTTTATMRDGRWLLDGTKTPVIAGGSAGVVLVYARTEQGPGWFCVDTADAAVTRTPLTSLDPTRELTALTFSNAAATPLSASDPAATLAVVADLASVALAAESVGAMQRAMEVTVEYAKVRVQFGRAIGSYQAVKHGCADMYCAWEHAVSVLRYATWAADAAPQELPVASALAQTYVGPAFFETATGMVQYHGGIGYTWEHDAHLFYKRAKSSQLLFGPPSTHRARLADRLGVR